MQRSYSDVHTQVDCLNTIGLIEESHYRTDSSCYYFQKSLDLAQAYKIEEWIGVVSGNLGFCLYQQKEFDVARELLQLDYDLSISQGDLNSAYLAFMTLTEIEILEGNTDLAAKNLAYVQNRIATEPDLQNDMLKITTNQVQSLLYEQLGDSDKALKYFKETQILRNNYNLDRDKQDLEKMEFQIRFEKELLEKEKANLERKAKNRLILLTVISFIIVLAYLLLLLKKIKNEKEWLRMEDERKQEELADAEKFMDSMRSGIRDKNNIIAQLQAQLEAMGTSSISQDLKSSSLKQIEELKNSVVLTEDDWIQFKKQFRKIYPNFIPLLIKTNPSLTNAEIRLATLLKLNLSTTEISNTLGISADSVRKTNLRLRNKLESKMI